MRRSLYYGLQSELGSGEPSESGLGLSSKSNANGARSGFCDLFMQVISPFQFLIFNF